MQPDQESPTDAGEAPAEPGDSDATASSFEPEPALSTQGVRRQPVWTYFLTPASILAGALIIAAAIWVRVGTDEEAAAPATAADTTGGVSGLPGGQDPDATLQDVLAGYAQSIGMDEAQYSQCMATESNVNILNTHIGRGRDYGVSATPTFIVNNKKIVGAQPTAILAEVIEAELDGGHESVDQYSTAIQQLATAGRFEILAESPDISDAEIEGAADAKVIVAEFTDFQCPFCKRWVDQSLASIREETGDEVAFAFMHFPIQQLHPNAPYAHVASVCAGQQGKFWEMHDILFARQDEWSDLSR